MRCRSASFDSWHSKSQTPRLGHSLIPSLTNGPYQDLASINQASLSLHGRVKLDDKLAGSKPRFDDRVVARFRSEVTKLCMKDGKPHEYRSQIHSTFVSALPGISSMGLVLRNPSSSCTLNIATIFTGSAKAARKALLAMCNLLLPSSTSTPASSGGEDHTLIKILKDLVQGPSKCVHPDPTLHLPTVSASE